MWELVWEPGSWRYFIWRAPNVDHHLENDTIDLIDRSWENGGQRTLSEWSTREWNSCANLQLIGLPKSMIHLAPSNSWDIICWGLLGNSLPAKVCCQFREDIHKKEHYFFRHCQNHLDHLSGLSLVIWWYGQQQESCKSGESVSPLTLLWPVYLSSPRWDLIHGKVWIWGGDLMGRWDRSCFNPSHQIMSPATQDSTSWSESHGWKQFPNISLHIC